MARKRIHWQAPTTIIVALVAGTIFAVGHHVFYKSIDGQPATNDNYNVLGSRVSAQQVNVAGGTAFAFLVKACLATAIGAAYAQLFWRAMLHRTPDVTLERLDATFSAVTNIHHLFKVWIWLRYPALFTLALIAWIIPIASIVTPATLSVISTAIIPPPTSLQYVPSIDFVSLNYVTYMTQGGYSYELARPNVPVQFIYNGPNKAVVNVAQAVAVEGSVLPIRGPGLNSTYRLRFAGPALQCSDMPSELRSSIEDNVIQAIQPGSPSCKAYGFLGWTPAYNRNHTALLSPPLPFTRTSNQSYVLNSASMDGGAPASVYIAAFPNMMKTVSVGSSHQVTPACQSGVFDDLDSRASYLANATMLQCDLHNSTYDIDFRFVNGEQHISIEIHPLDPKIMTTVYSAFGPPSHPSPGGKASGPACSPLNDDATDKCLFNATLVRTLAYQAIMEAFNELIVGAVYIENYGIATNFDSSIQDTVLADSPELKYLNEKVTLGGTVQQRTLQQNVLASNGSLFSGVLNNQSSVTAPPLITALQSLFQNITVSMMTSKKLQPDYASTFAPPAVNVTLHTYRNVYTYSAYKLWVAYGLAISFAAICALVGLITIGANGASYSLSFSTVLRASRSAYTDVELKENDVDIRDPLPSHMARAKLWLGSPPKGSNIGGSKDDGGARGASAVEHAPMLAVPDGVDPDQHARDGVDQS